MDTSSYRPGLGLIGTGFALWVIGVLLAIIFPPLTAVGVVLVLFGKILVGIGVILLIGLFVRGLF